MAAAHSSAAIPTTVTSSMVSSAVGPSSTSTGSPPPSSSSSSSGGGGSSSQKPLLFFVALGFGVVFINLWIIVGVKYCFRYNRRHRQAQHENENSDNVGLGTMPRPRRRREKKLMTMEEVNDRFPLTKYKLWRAAHEQEDGLRAAADGITAPASGPASLKEVSLGRSSDERRHSSTTNLNDVSTVLTNDSSIFNSQKADTHHHDTSATANPTDHAPNALHDQSTSKRPSIENEVSNSTAALVAAPVIDVPKPFYHNINASAPEIYSRTQQSRKVARVALAEKIDTNIQPSQVGVLEISPTPIDEEDDEDPISTALPAELIASPGDTCAICLDALEDDDDVRGLLCGHAFHAGCIDPWLLSRRACCPLCKADYYIPKPRPEAEAAAPGHDFREHENTFAPQLPWPSSMSGAFRPRAFFSNSRQPSQVSQQSQQSSDRFAFFSTWGRSPPSRNPQYEYRWSPPQVPMNTMSRPPTNSARRQSASNAEGGERRGFRARYMDAMLSLQRSGASNRHARDETTRRLSEVQVLNSRTPGQLEAGR